MSILPETGFLRLSDFIGSGKLIPISKSAWWAGVAEGRYPAAVKLGPRTTVWRVEDIKSLIEHPESALAKRGGPHETDPQNV